MKNNSYQGIIHQYRHYLNLDAQIEPISLLEGNTPLIPLQKISKELGRGMRLWAKFEGLNPTGSFKDRGMTTAVSEANYRGADMVICASTGNTAASAAAYAARAGMRSVVIIPAGKVAAGKLAGAIAYGAEVIQIDGFFDDALNMVLNISQKYPIALVNSLNPFRLEGQKTAAFEICDVLGNAPDWLALPVGNAGNITSYWMGFKQYQQVKQTGLPKILGAQASGAAPLVVGRPVNNPETIATAIRIGKPARGEEALSAASESGGKIIAVSDGEILSAQKILAGEGLWVEPASAAGLAAVIQQAQINEMQMRDQEIVVVCTGHGLKDAEIITKTFKKPQIIPAEIGALEEIILNA